MNPETLSDQAAREAIRHRHDANLFVQAGAGTGKTTELVARLTNLLASPDGPKIDQIVAITFTRAAASELRERLRFSLENRAAGADDEATVARCRSALAGLELAAIGTIDRFAQDLLRLPPLDAAVPPGFRIVEGAEAEVRFQRWWRQCLRELTERQGLEDAWDTLQDAEISFTALEESARRMADQWDTLRSGFPTVDIRAEVEAICASGAPFFLACEDCRDPSDKLYLVYKDAERIVDAVRSCENEREMIRLLGSLPAAGNVGSSRAWPNDFKEVRREYAAWRKGAVEHFPGLLRYQSLYPLLQALADEVVDAAEARCRAGEMRFRDVLVTVRDRLEQDQDFRTTVGERYRMLCIDEFQDTDPVQAEIAALIAQVVGGPEAWPAGRPDPGKLFLVGDPKQSIYRFRGADVELYRWFGRSFGLEPTELRTNFRSQPEIVSSVNELFTGLFARGGNAPFPVALDPGRTAADGRVHLLGVPNPDGKSKAWQLKQIEAECVATQVVRALREGWKVGGRPCRPSDLAILIPSRGGQEDLLLALHGRGVPVRVESDILLLDHPDVHQLQVILEALADPTDDVAVVAALRTPCLGVSDPDLQAYARAGGTWIAREDSIAQVGPESVRAGLRKLARTASEIRDLCVAEAVGTVVRTFDCCPIAYLVPRPEDVLRRLARYEAEARAFGTRPGATLCQFVQAMRLQHETQTRVQDAARPDPEDEAVRLVTIHGSKGLEYPIVFVCGLDALERERDTGFSLDESRRPAWKTGSTSGQSARPLTVSPNYDRGKNKARATDERDRLLYVALTRARDHLVVFVPAEAQVRADVRESTLAKRLLVEIQATGREAAPCAPDAHRWVGPAPRVAYLGTREEWEAERDRVLAEAGLKVRSATSIAHARDGKDDAVHVASSEDSEERRSRGRAATAYGRAVHSVLQFLDFDEPNDLEDLARTQAEVEGVPKRCDDIVMTVHTALAHVPAPRPGGRRYKEAFFASKHEGWVLEGYLDLLVEEPDGLRIVDYKTDRVATEADVDRRMVDYRIQAGVYALLVHAATGVWPVGCRFLFVSPDRCLVRDVGDPEAAACDALERLRWPE